MKIKLITLGSKMPAWVTTAFNEYQKRLPREIALSLLELDLPKRQKNSNLQQLITKEGDAMLAQIAKSDYVVALDEHGEQWSTMELSQQLETWLQSGQDICLLVGGPDGLAPACKQRAQTTWALSALTLPHPLVRPIIAEQIYRAWSIISNHPYHRE